MKVDEKFAEIRRGKYIFMYIQYTLGKAFNKMQFLRLIRI